MKPRIQRFNLIEIALAMGILAVGVSSLMVLYPVGIRASGAAQAENNLPNIVERIVSELELRLRNETDWSAGAAAAIPTTKTASTFDNFDAFTESSVSFAKDTVFKGNGVFWFAKARPGADMPDFSAEVKYWRGNASSFKTPWDGATRTPGGQQQLVLYVEVSWPLDMSYALRENEGNVRTFQIDVLNPGVFE